MPEIRSGRRRPRRRGSVAGGRRCRLVQHREPVPRDRSRIGRGLAAQVPRLRQRLAARALSLVACLPAAAQRARGLGAAARPAERLDEALSPAGDAADRAVDPRVVELAAPHLAARAGDVVPALSLPPRPASPGRLGLLQHRRLLPVLAARGRPDPRARAGDGARGRRDRLRLAAAGRRAAVAGPGSGRRESITSRTAPRRRSWPSNRSRGRPSAPPTWPTCLAPISATSARWRTASTGS